MVPSTFVHQKNIPAFEREGKERAGAAGRCCEILGRDARARAGAAVEKKAFVFFALRALREMRETLRVVSIVEHSERQALCVVYDGEGG